MSPGSTDRWPYFPGDGLHSPRRSGIMETEYPALPGTQEEKTMIIAAGRPESAEGRLPREMRVYDFLDGLGVRYERADHEPAASMEDCAVIGEALGTKICKNLFLCNRQGTKFWLLLMPGDKPFKTKELSAQIASSRLSFGSPAEMLRLLDTEPGAASVMGLMNDRAGEAALLIDRDVLKEEYFGCHPCVNTSSLRLRTEDLTDKVLPALGRRPQIVELRGTDV